MSTPRQVNPRMANVNTNELYASQVFSGVSSTTDSYPEYDDVSRLDSDVAEEDE